MTLEEKIEHLRIAAMEDARKEGNLIISRYKSSIDQIFEDHKRIALRQSDLSIKTANDHAKHQLNRALATAQTEFKRKQGQTQTKLKARLFANINDLLEAYMKTEAYVDLLVSYVKQALDFAQSSPVTIYLNESDSNLKEELELKTGVTLTLSSRNFVGGIRTVVRDRNILIDRSFASAIAEEYEKFLFSGGDDNE